MSICYFLKIGREDMLEELCLDKREISELLGQIHVVPKSVMPKEHIEAIEDYLKNTATFSELSYHDQLKSYLFLREGYLCRGCTVEAANNIVSQYDSSEFLYKGFDNIANRKLSNECNDCSARKLISYQD